MVIEVKNENAMRAFGSKLGGLLAGRQVVELVGDVGAGKTTLAKGIAEGLGVDEDVQSPSFTISRVYEAHRGLRLAHYDFYRLHAAGIMANDLDEAMSDPQTVTLIEWANIVDGVLPIARLTIEITTVDEFIRSLRLRATGETSQQLIEALR